MNKEGFIDFLIAKNYTKGTIYTYVNQAERLFNKIQEEIGYDHIESLYSIDNVNNLLAILAEKKNYCDLDYLNHSGVVGIGHYINYLSTIIKQSIEITYTAPDGIEARISFSHFSGKNVDMALDFIAICYLGVNQSKLRDRLECIANQLSWFEFVPDLYRILTHEHIDTSGLKVTIKAN